MMPSRQMGSVLYQNLLTEEQTTHCAGDDCLNSIEYISFHSTPLGKNISFRILYRFPKQDFLLSRFLEDIKTPPPIC